MRALSGKRAPGIEIGGKQGEGMDWRDEETG
jgi:hypothetical protein